MKLILSSAGFRTRAVAEKAAELVGKPLEKINIAIVDEARRVSPLDQHWFIDEVSQIAQNIGGEIYFVSPTAMNIATVEQLIANADMIYVVGGNPKFLEHVFETTSFAKLLREKLLNEKVYVGSSAGSMVMGYQIPKYNSLFKKDDRTFGVSEFQKIVDFGIVPHYGTDVKGCREVEQLTEGFDRTIFALKDSQAIVVIDDEISFVGGAPARFGGEK